MKFVAGVAFLALSAAVSSANAAELPQLKTTDKNTVPDCATPGRLMAFVKARNDKVDARFDGVATEYMRHGEDLRIRWDIAFFQMLVETGNLTFKGDVKPKQNNFAGLGATGGGEPGETFKDVSTGVRAHLEHVLMYSGERIENPVAERTRKVQEWGVLTSWQKSLKGPITFSQLTRKWSPRDRGYSNDIDSVAQSFMGGACKAADPRPELVAVARKDLMQLAAAQPDKTKARGAEAAQRNVDAARAEGQGRSALGATAIAKAGETPALVPKGADAKPQPAVVILNGPKDEPAAGAVAKDGVPPAAAETLRNSTATAKADDAAKKKPAAAIETAALPPAAMKQPGVATAAPAAGGACRVWTASYGGNKAMIIKVVDNATTNYTVLDVNEGREKREADAYIAAYAKGGQPVGEFATQDQALDKAFELCPEG